MLTCAVVKLVPENAYELRNSGLCPRSVSSGPVTDVFVTSLTLPNDSACRTKQMVISRPTPDELPTEELPTEEAWAGAYGGP